MPQQHQQLNPELLLLLHHQHNLPKLLLLSLQSKKLKFQHLLQLKNL
jgi:hypothetical protein